MTSRRTRVSSTGRRELRRRPGAGASRDTSGRARLIKILAHEAEDLYRGRAPTPLLQRALLEQGVGNVGDGRPCAKKQLELRLPLAVEAVIARASLRESQPRELPRRAPPRPPLQGRRGEKSGRPAALRHPSFKAPRPVLCCLRPQKRLRRRSPTLRSSATRHGRGSRPT